MKNLQRWVLFALFGIVLNVACEDNEFQGEITENSSRKNQAGYEIKGQAIADQTVNMSEEDSMACPFFDPNKLDYKAQIPGGPPIEVGRKNFEKIKEDGEIVICELTAYQGAIGTKTNFNATTEKDYTIPSEMSASPFAKEKFGESTDWQLEPFPWASVKHIYRVIIKDIKSSKCTAQAKEEREPFLTRGQDYDNSGCFDLLTPIRMADGKDQLAYLINVGDLVFNPVTKKSAKVSKVVEGPELKGMFLIGFGNQSIKVTSTHPFLTASGLKKAEQLQLNEKILGSDGKYHALTVVQQLPSRKTQRAINFTVNAHSTKIEDHLVLANGVVTGDLYLQQKLEREQSLAITKP